MPNFDNEPAAVEWLRLATIERKTKWCPVYRLPCRADCLDWVDGTIVQTGAIWTAEAPSCVNPGVTN